MARYSRKTYHHERGLEEAVVDLVRLGSSGHASGVRQLAAALVRSVPSSVTDPDGFRLALREAMAPAPPEGLRFGAGEVPTDDGSTHALVAVDPAPDGSGLVLEPRAMEELREIVEERRRAGELARAGVTLTRTLLLSGEPGVGKSMAARWLAQEIGVPLVSVDLATVVSSFLGSSGRNIRAALEYAKSGSCVMLLDEFDALAKRRDDDADVGELKRIVNVILIELDRWPDSSLLVAATNHAKLLDVAAYRRFERRLEVMLPGATERRAILDRLAAGTGSQDDPILDLVTEVTASWSGSDLKRLWDASMRRSVLQGTPPTEQMLQELARRVHRKGRERDRFWLALSDRLHMSARQIATLVGVSHPTVGEGLARARGGGSSEPDATS